MNILRTPDERFENLADFAFLPNYLEIPDGQGGELRVHYLDEGAADGPIVLLMHGQPSWCYLYRFMIGPLVDAGFRVVAPDLIGFGRSDKPTEIEDYTYARHIAWMTAWLEGMNNGAGISDITLFCQDWGSLIGLRLVAAQPERFAAVVLSNGGLPAGMVPEEFAEPLKEAYKTLPVVKAEELGERFADTSGIPGFLYWRKFCAESEDLDIGQVMSAAGGRSLSPEEKDAYRAPFPDQSYLAGARKFPALVPLFLDEPEAAENKEAMAELCNFNKPFMTAFADNDPVTAGGEKTFQEGVIGAQGIAHRTIENAGHFLQQDAPDACVQAILDVTGRG